MSDPAPAQRLPQLRMEIAGLHARITSPAAARLPSGYGLRTFRPGDEDAWLALLLSGEFSPWSRERLDGLLANEEVRTSHAGVFFATVDDRPVGTASTQLHSGPDGIDAELAWVVVAPEHRGHGLGGIVCLAVLGYVRGLGLDRAFLKTDDHRLPAIQSYLTLGFEPALIDPSHPDRWAEIQRLLAAHH